MLRRWLVASAYNLDRFLASTLLGAPPQETISSQAARARDRGERWGRLLCGALGLVRPGHCDKALDDAQRLDAADRYHEES